ncbi:hypothetical protein ACFCXT_17430 [Streptomyces vinaceus]|uniref:hypothetical protein n=1 Tax=Streptomyces vinaceus TaxID=1960 RepID=UPI0035D66EBC
MAIIASTAVNNLLFGLTGSRLPQADEDKAYQSRVAYQRMARQLRELSDLIEGSVVGVGRSLPPQVGPRYVRAMNLFVDDNGRNVLRDFSEELDRIADGRTKTSMDITEAKWQIIAEVVRLMIELMITAILSFFSGGAGAGRAAVARAQSRLAILTIMDALLSRTRLMPTLSSAFDEAFQTFVVRLAMMVAGPDGRRPRDFDWGQIGQDAAFGALVGMFAHLFDGATRKFDEFFDKAHFDDTVRRNRDELDDIADHANRDRTPDGPRNSTRDFDGTGPNPRPVPDPDGNHLGNGPRTQGDQNGPRGEGGVDESTEFLTEALAEVGAEFLISGWFTGTYATSWETFYGSMLSAKSEQLLEAGAEGLGEAARNVSPINTAGFETDGARSNADGTRGGPNGQGGAGTRGRQGDREEWHTDSAPTSDTARDVTPPPPAGVPRAVRTSSGPATGTDLRIDTDQDLHVEPEPEPEAEPAVAPGSSHARQDAAATPDSPISTASGPGPAPHAGTGPGTTPPRAEAGPQGEADPDAMPEAEGTPEADAGPSTASGPAAGPGTATPTPPVSAPPGTGPGTAANPNATPGAGPRTVNTGPTTTGTGTGAGTGTRPGVPDVDPDAPPTAPARTVSTASGEGPQPVGEPAADVLTEGWNADGTAEAEQDEAPTALATISTASNTATAPTGDPGPTPDSSSDRTATVTRSAFPVPGSGTAPAPAPVRTPEHVLWQQLFALPEADRGPVLDEIAARRDGDGPRSEEIEQRVRVRDRLSRTSEITIVIDDGANYGHQAAATMLMDSLGDLGYQGAIRVIAAESVQDRLRLLLPAEVSGRIMWVTDYFDPDADTARRNYGEDHVVMVAASDRIGKDPKVAARFLNFAGTDRAIVLKPYVWAEGSRVLYSRGGPDETPEITDLESLAESDDDSAPGTGGETARLMGQPALYRFHVPEPTPAELDALIARKLAGPEGGDTPRSTNLRAIARAVTDPAPAPGAAGPTDLMPAYGLHNVPPERRAGMLATLASGIHEAAPDRPSVLLALGRVGVDLAPAHTAPWYTRMALDDPELPARLAAQGPGDVLVVEAGSLPQDVFRQMYRLGTLPAVLEGANTANLVQVLGRPYFSVLTNHTPYDRLDPLAANALQEVTAALRIRSQWGRKAAARPEWKAVADKDTALDVLAALEPAPGAPGGTTRLTLDEMKRLKAGFGEHSADRIGEFLGAQHPDAEAARMMLRHTDVPDREQQLAWTRWVEEHGGREPAVDLTPVQRAGMTRMLRAERAAAADMLREATKDIPVAPTPEKTAAVAEAIRRIATPGSTLHSYFAALARQARDPRNDQVLQALDLGLSDTPKPLLTISNPYGQVVDPADRYSPLLRSEPPTPLYSANVSARVSTASLLPVSPTGDSLAVPSPIRTTDATGGWPDTQNRPVHDTTAEDDEDAWAFDFDDDGPMFGSAEPGLFQNGELPTALPLPQDPAPTRIVVTGPVATPGRPPGVLTLDLDDGGRPVEERTPDATISNRALPGGGGTGSYTPANWAARAPRFGDVTGATDYSDLRTTLDGPGASTGSHTLVGGRKPLPWQPGQATFFAGHGTATRVVLALPDGSVVQVSGRELGRFLSRQNGLGPAGRPIVLYACSTGRPPGHGGVSVAQHVANITRRTVHAPTTDAGTARDGSGQIRPILHLDPADGTPGQWAEFTPEPEGDRLDELARTAGLHQAPGEADPFVRTRTLQLVRTLRAAFGTDAEAGPDAPALLRGLAALDALRWNTAPTTDALTIADVADDPLSQDVPDARSPEEARHAPDWPTTARPATTFTVGRMSLDLLTRISRSVLGPAATGAPTRDQFGDVLAAAAAARDADPGSRIEDLAARPATPSADANPAPAPAPVLAPALTSAATEGAAPESDSEDPASEVLSDGRRIQRSGGQYEVVPTSADGDCLFHSVLRGLRRTRPGHFAAGMTVQEVRDAVAAAIPGSGIADAVGEPLSTLVRDLEADELSRLLGAPRPPLSRDQRAQVAAAPAQDRPRLTATFQANSLRRVLETRLAVGDAEAERTWRRLIADRYPRWSPTAPTLAEFEAMTGADLVAQAIRDVNMWATPFFDPAADAVAQALGVDLVLVQDNAPDNHLGAPTQPPLYVHYNGVNHYSAVIVHGNPSGVPMAAGNPSGSSSGGDSGAGSGKPATPDAPAAPAKKVHFADPLGTHPGDDDAGDGDGDADEGGEGRDDGEPDDDGPDPAAFVPVEAALATHRPARLDRSMLPPLPPTGPVTFTDGSVLPGYLTGDPTAESRKGRPATKGRAPTADVSGTSYGHSAVRLRGIDAVVTEIAGRSGVPDTTRVHLDQALRAQPRSFNAEGYSSPPFTDAGGRVRVLRVRTRPYGNWERFTDVHGTPVKIDEAQRSQVTTGAGRGVGQSVSLSGSVPIGPPAGPAAFGRIGGSLGYTKSFDYALQNQTLSAVETRMWDGSHLHLDDVQYEVWLSGDPEPRTGGAVTWPRAFTAGETHFTFGVHSGLSVRLSDSETKSPGARGRVPSEMDLGPDTDYRLVHTEGYGPVAGIRAWALARARVRTGSTAHNEISGFFTTESFHRMADRLAHGPVAGRPLMDEGADGTPLGAFVVDRVVPGRAVLLTESEAAEMRNTIQQTAKAERSLSKGYSQELNAAAGPSVDLLGGTGKPVTLRGVIGAVGRYVRSSTYGGVFGGSGGKRSANRAKKVPTALYLVQKTVYVRAAGDAEPTAFPTWSLDRMTRTEARRHAGWDDGTTLRSRNGSEPFAPLYLTREDPAVLGMARPESFTHADGSQVRTTAGAAGAGDAEAPAPPPPPGPTLLQEFTDQVIRTTARRYPGMIAPLAELNAREGRWSDPDRYRMALQNTLTVINTLSHHSMAGNLETIVTSGVRIDLVGPGRFTRAHRHVWIDGRLTDRRYEGTQNDLIHRTGTPGTERLDGSRSATRTFEGGFDASLSIRDADRDAGGSPWHAGTLSAGPRWGKQTARKTSYGATASFEAVAASAGPSHLFGYELELTATSGGYWRPRNLLRGLPTLGLLGTGLFVVGEAERPLVGGTAGDPVRGRVLLSVPSEHTPKTDPAAAPPGQAAAPAPGTVLLDEPLTGERAERLATGRTRSAAEGHDTPFGDHPYQTLGVGGHKRLAGAVEDVMRQASGNSWHFGRTGAPAHDAMVRPFQPPVLAATFDQTSGTTGSRIGGLFGKGPYLNRLGALVHRTRVVDPRVISDPLKIETEMTLGNDLQAGGGVTRTHTFSIAGGGSYSTPHQAGPGVGGTYGATGKWGRSRATSRTVTRTVSSEVDRDDEGHVVLVAGDTEHDILGESRAGGILAPLHGIATALRANWAGRKLRFAADWLGHLPEKAARRLGLLNDDLGPVPVYRSSKWTQPSWLRAHPFGSYPVNALDPSEVLAAFDKDLRRLGIDDAGCDRVHSMVTPRVLKALREDMTGTGAKARTRIGGWGWRQLRLGGRTAALKVELIAGEPEFDGLDHSVSFWDTRTATETVDEGVTASVTKSGGISVSESVRTGAKGAPSAGPSYGETGSTTRSAATSRGAARQKSYTFYANEPHAEFLTPYRIRLTLDLGDGTTVATRTGDVGRLREHVPLSLTVPVPPRPAAAQADAQAEGADEATDEATDEAAAEAEQDRQDEQADRTADAKGHDEATPSADGTPGPLDPLGPPELDDPGPAVRVWPGGAVTAENIAEWRAGGDGSRTPFELPENGFHVRRLTALDTLHNSADLAVALSYGVDALPADKEARTARKGKGARRARPVAGKPLDEAFAAARTTGLTRPGSTPSLALHDGIGNAALATFFGDSTGPGGHQVAGLTETNFIGGAQGDFRMFARPNLAGARLLTVAHDSGMESAERQTDTADFSASQSGAQDSSLGGAPAIGAGAAGSTVPGLTGGLVGATDSATAKIAGADAAQLNVKPKAGRAFLFAVPTDWLGVADVERTVKDSRPGAWIGKAFGSVKPGPQAVETSGHVLAWVREDVARAHGLITDANYPPQVAAAWTATGRAGNAWADADRAYWAARRAVPPELRQEQLRTREEARAAKRAFVASIEADRTRPEGPDGEVLPPSQETVRARRQLQEAQAAAREAKHEAAVVSVDLKQKERAARRAARTFHSVRAATDRLTRWHQLPVDPPAAAADPTVPTAPTAPTAPTVPAVADDPSALTAPVAPVPPVTPVAPEPERRAGLTEPPAPVFVPPAPPAAPERERFTQESAPGDTGPATLTAPDGERYTLPPEAAGDAPGDGDGFYTSLAEALRHTRGGLPEDLPLGTRAELTGALRGDLRRELADALTGSPDSLTPFLAPDSPDTFTAQELAAAGVDLADDAARRHEFEDSEGKLPLHLDLDPAQRAALADAQLARTADAPDHTRWDHGAADLLPALAARRYGVTVTVVRADGGSQSFVPPGGADTDPDAQVVLVLRGRRYHAAVPEHGVHALGRPALPPRVAAPAPAEAAPLATDPRPAHIAAPWNARPGYESWRWDRNRPDRLTAPDGTAYDVAEPQGEGNGFWAALTAAGGRRSSPWAGLERYPLPEGALLDRTAPFTGAELHRAGVALRGQHRAAFRDSGDLLPEDLVLTAHQERRLIRTQLAAGRDWNGHTAELAAQAAADGHGGELTVVDETGSARTYVPAVATAGRPPLHLLRRGREFVALTPEHAPEPVITATDLNRPAFQDLHVGPDEVQGLGYAAGPAAAWSLSPDLTYRVADLGLSEADARVLFQRVRTRIPEPDPLEGSFV